MAVRVVPFGEAALLVELEQRIDPAVAARAAAIADRWEALGHGPAVPTYACVLLRYDPLVLDYDGPDLDDVARLSGMSRREIIDAHTSREHPAYFLGFMPGFAYCGGLDPRIIAPRLPSPRTRVPAGSVAVVDGQTAVYPATSPGGWRLIGTTDVVAFDAHRDPPALIRPGDRVRFVAR